VAELGAVIDAAILAGGLGTRLRQTVSDRPKALAPVAGRPFLSHLLDQIAAAGLQRVVLCTGYLGDQVQEAFGDRYGELALSYSHESSPRGTAGALRLALPLLRSDPVLVLNGDSYCDVALPNLVAWHEEHRTTSAGSLLVTWVDDTARYGTVDLDDAGAVIAFREKSGQAIPGWINAGVYLLSRRLLMSIPAGIASLERDVLPSWVGRGLDGYRMKLPFVDIGTPESYARAEALLAQRHR
jgi:NDP-sugar pyrophosphorylase family protein